MLKFRTVNTIAILCLLLLVVMNFIFGGIMWLVIVLIVVWITLTAIGSFHLRWDYHLKLYHKNNETTAKVLAITFDDGPHPIYTPQVLDLLKKYNAKASFFCIGQKVKKHPEILRDLLDQGHVVGNHSYSHAWNFGFFNTPKVIEELHKTNAIVQSISGLEMKLFRPPYGVTNPSIKKALDHTKHLAIGWSVRSLDTTGRSAEVVYDRIIKRYENGGVVLMHDTSAKTVSVLEHLLLDLSQKGYKFVSVDSLFKVNAYEA